MNSDLGELLREGIERATVGERLHPSLAGRARQRHHRRLVTVRAAAAGGTAVVAAAAVFATTIGAQSPGGNFAAATTVAAVLDNAALAALREPTVTPRPGQFVYTKTYAAVYQARHHGNPAVRGTQSIESWKSVGGTHRVSP
jgi:hypothetical protein